MSEPWMDWVEMGDFLERGGGGVLSFLDYHYFFRSLLFVRFCCVHCIEIDKGMGGLFAYLVIRRRCFQEVCRE